MTIDVQQYSTCVYDRGYLYGFMDVRIRRSGTALPRSTDGPDPVASPRSASGSLILVGNQLLILTVDGKLCWRPRRPKALTRWPRQSWSARVTRALPALAKAAFSFATTMPTHGLESCMPRTCVEKTEVPQPPPRADEPVSSLPRCVPS